ncbi:unnamed protein product [Macrosiphum euphorbiae]|uniref:C2H2-type domain-containing protein n=1 Tax=Macrosiphum euphorbiae TaxID=13131 RepID=A0AAV0WTK1_9HEMI|nr:unnamed protein product [Macrosiphum euphorbiae]
MEFNKPDPLKMTGNLVENFRNFRYQLQMYFNATECHSKEEATQVAILLDLLGSDCLKIYNTLKIPSITVFEILKALEAYCIPPRRNETMQQYKFFTRKQLDGEPFNKYYADLRELVKSCELNTCDKLLKIQIILGISDKELQARLLRDELTLEKTVKHCQIVEESKVNRKLIQENTKKLLNIEAEQHKGSNQYSRGVKSNFRKPTQHKQSNGKGDGKFKNIMEKHIDLQHKNIKIEMEDNNEEEFTDIGYNIDKNKHKNNNFRNVSVNKETNSIIKTEKDETVFNDCVFESKIEIEMVHATDPIENCNNPNPTVGGQMDNREKEYQYNICNKSFQDKNNLEVHKSLHANIKKFNCMTCGEQFFELNGLKTHLMVHKDNNIKLLENQFTQECNDVGDSNSNLWTVVVNNETNTIIETEQDETVFNDCVFDSETEIEMAHATDPIENCNNPNPTEHEMEIGIEKEYKNDEMYNCAKCSLQFHDRPSIIDHLNPHIDQCINCCKYIGSPTSCKYPVSIQEHPRTSFYFECEECYNEFYTLKSFERYLSAQSNKKTDRPYKCDICLKTYINLYHFAAHQRLHKGAKPFVCDLCGEAFPARLPLNKHKKTNHTCYICNKFFNDPKELNVHKITHEEFKLNHYACKLCDKAFKNQLTLDRHQLTHQVEKPFKCDFCPKAFTRTDCLVNHRRIHTGEKPFKCDLCKKTYPRFGSLTRHEAIVHNK